MPYITQARREALKPALDKAIATFSYDGFKEGDLNYFISSLFLSALRQNKSYATINKLLGVLEAIKLEFYRVYATNYEEEKRKLHGGLGDLY